MQNKLLEKQICSTGIAQTNMDFFRNKEDSVTSNMDEVQ